MCRHTQYANSRESGGRKILKFKCQEIEFE